MIFEQALVGQAGNLFALSSTVLGFHHLIQSQHIAPLFFHHPSGIDRWGTRATGFRRDIQRNGDGKGCNIAIAIVGFDMRVDDAHGRKW